MTFERSALRARVRSPLGSRNGLRPATVELWGLSGIDLVLSGPLVDGYFNPQPFAAQSPAAALTAAAAANWSAVNCWWPGGGSYYPPGFPSAGADVIASGVPCATGAYAGSNAPGTVLGTYVAGPYAPAGPTWPYAGITRGAPYHSTIPYPGSCPQFGAGNVAAWVASLFYFWPGPASATNQWLNWQNWQRVRYRLQYPGVQMPGFRLQCELRGQAQAAGLWADGITRAQFALGGVPLRIIPEHFSFVSWLSLPNHPPSPASDGSHDWVEVPLPTLPGSWNAQANATAGGCLLGLATMDFWGMGPSQWMDLTGEQISGV